MADTSKATEGLPEHSERAQPATANLPETVQPIGNSALSGRGSRFERSTPFFPTPTINHYPSDFDDAERDMIKAAELRARAAIEQKKDSVKSPAERDDLSLRDWVLPIFTVCSELACERVRSGLWRVHKAEPEMLEYLGYLTRMAGLNSDTEWMGDGTPVIRADIQSQIERSAEWKAHRQRLNGLARALATNRDAPLSTEGPGQPAHESIIPPPIEEPGEIQTQTSHTSSVMANAPAVVLKTAEQCKDPVLKKKLIAVLLYDHHLAELQTIRVACRRHQNAKTLKHLYPDFFLWEVIEDREAQELVEKDFTPNVFAWSLVKRELGLSGNGNRTLKNYRSDLRAAALVE